MKKLNEILGTELPFNQGGMANIATGEFAAACSNAGALGMIATGGQDCIFYAIVLGSAEEIPLRGLHGQKLEDALRQGILQKPAGQLLY